MEADARPPAPARVIHHTATRTRFRIQEAREPEFFEGVAEALERRADVTAVECNALTSTVLVHHRAGLTVEDLLGIAEEEGCFALGDPAATGTPVQEIRELYQRLETEARRMTGGRFDIESGVLVLLLWSTVQSVVRGNIAVPAAAAAWQALELIRRRAEMDPEQT